MGHIVNGGYPHHSQKWSHLCPWKVIAHIFLYFFKYTLLMVGGWNKNSVLGPHYSFLFEFKLPSYSFGYWDRRSWKIHVFSFIFALISFWFWFKSSIPIFCKFICDEVVLSPVQSHWSYFILYWVYFRNSKPYLRSNTLIDWRH